MKRTKDLFLIFRGGSELQIEGYSDLDFMSNPDDRKSTLGYVFVCNDGAVSWKSSKQSIIADSTIEAEYNTALDATKEGFWFKKFIAELRIMTSNVILLYCDNNGAIAIAKEPRSRCQDLIKNQSTSSDSSISYVTTLKKNMSRYEE